MKRPALIFDFGNVVAFFDHSRAFEEFSPHVGRAPREVLEWLREQGFTRLLASYESGAIDSQSFARSVCELAGVPIAPERFERLWADVFWLNDPVARLIRHLRKAGYRLVLGSNTNEVHARRFLSQFEDVLACFDRIVLSYEVGVLKPQRGFYEACANAAGVPADQCVFIDDVAENVDGAKRAGLRGVHFREVPSLISDLRALGVEVEIPEV